MIGKNQILKMAQRITRRGQNLPDQKLMHPDREWYIGLSIALLIAILGVCYNAYTFSYYNDAEYIVLESEAVAVKYEKDVVERVLKEYEAKDERFNALKAGLPEVVVSTTTEEETGEIGSVEMEVRAE